MTRDRYDDEEEFHAKDRKHWRKERKHAQQTDRSKFKKTDQEKKEPEALDPNLKRGRVVAISGEGSWVDSDGVRFLCSLKGLFKKEKMQSKNLIAVGDLVRFEPTSEKEGNILQMEERYSFLGRMDISGKKEQLIAVNVDQVIIAVSVVNPDLKPALVDRYMIAASKGNIQPIIVVNKIDLLESASEAERTRYHEFLSAYEPLGFPILSLSTTTGVGVEALRSLLKNKTSVFSGQSGVGKSSLLNACFGLSLKTGGLAQKTFKGTHTTSTAELISLPEGGYCVDTPGIRSFGIWALKKEDVISHFHDLERASGCKYPDCAHLSEPGCAVLQALEEGQLPRIRYESYCSLLDEATGGADNRTKRKAIDPDFE